MVLERYRAKRNFAKTPEPAGDVRPAPGRRFVIQKHAARRLHYDFRLELDGVLKSWAVPKGPSFDPAEKRLAVHVEDHPIEYGDFEGVIPAGQYGGGTVLLWDRGTWEPEGDPQKGYRSGKLVFRLVGEKLAGGWSLVRMRTGEDADNWLLIKRDDDAARPLAEGDILVERSESVATGRDLKEIAAAGDRVWHSNRPVERAEERREAGSTRRRTPVGRASAKRAAAKRSGSAKRAGAPARIPGARKRAMPKWIEPQLATRVRDAPTGDGWLHEIKLDGYRALIQIDGGRARLITRKGLDWSDRFAPLSEAAAQLPVRRALVDGEVAVVLPDGTTRFQALQEALSESRGEQLVFFAFDLLHLDDWDLTRAPLEARKEALARLLGDEDGKTIRYSDHVVGEGPAFFARACDHAIEGIVSKRRDAPYRPGRSRDWLKVKCVQRQDFVIGGWTDPEGSREGLGALLVGVRDREGGRLRYAGKVGTGFSGRTLTDLARRLAPLARDRSPFADSVPRAHARRAHWVAPRLVAEVEFAEWTRDGRLRHPSFQGLREDLPAGEVVREVAEPPPAARSPGKKRTARKQGREDESVRGVRLTNPDRVLWPEQGVTKRALAAYYAKVGHRMLPYVAGRPLTLVRCPQGRHHNCFYQKHADDAFPAVLRRVPIEEDDGQTGLYVAVDDVAGLVALAQVGVLEIHTWGSRDDDLERPDRVIFDLDPDPAVAWEDMIASARALADRLESLGLVAFLKTTGGKGLHIETPIVPEDDWDAVKAFARAIASEMVSDDPSSYVATASKARRRGKIYIDWLRNARGATAIAPYSTRARPNAPVATPVRWDELGKIGGPKRYTIANLPRRLATIAQDPWRGYKAARRPLTHAIERLIEKGKVSPDGGDHEPRHRHRSDGRTRKKRRN
jgi:bifunctional non-homologous end joining protein LigD